ncbi:MAG: ATP-binding cassette domain-containing protein [Phycisphaeraceae bacterium]|nr:ATP-binding cassette domain-containing protein [Phycisphaeraceae bacterium]
MSMPTSRSPDTQADPTSGRDSGEPYAVECRGVTVQRGARRILDDVSVKLQAGRCHVLLGPNGCGKTTLAGVITGAVPTMAGMVGVLGHVIGQCDIRALRRSIAVVNSVVSSEGHHPSNAAVDGSLSARRVVWTGFFGTVGLYDRPDAEQCELADRLLESMGMLERAGQVFQTLSSGEQRRVAMARALACRPRLLILDEPTTGLDPSAREQLLAALATVLNWPDPPTVLMITHHVEEIPRAAAQVILMKDGRIIDAGEPSRCMTPEQLTRLFDCRMYVRRVSGRWWLEVLPEAGLDWIRPLETGRG